MKFPIFAVDCSCFPCPLGECQKSEEKRRKKRKSEEQRKKRKKWEKWENSSDPIYTNPIKSLRANFVRAECLYKVKYLLFEWYGHALQGSFLQCAVTARSPAIAIRPVPGRCARYSVVALKHSQRTLSYEEATQFLPKGGSRKMPP